jgi:hypothetical protein
MLIALSTQSLLQHRDEILRQEHDCMKESKKPVDRGIRERYGGKRSFGIAIIPLFC